MNATIHVEKSSGCDELLNFARSDRTCEKMVNSRDNETLLYRRSVTFIMTIASDINEPPRDMTKNLRDFFVMAPFYVSYRYFELELT